MPRIPSPHDSASLFYRDYVPGTSLKGSKQNNLTLVFLHGWPMSSRMWQQHLLRLCQDHGFRCVAPDRRGFGDSEWNGRCSNDAEKNQITYETFADDVIFLLEELAVGNFVFIASSMGCGESLLAWERSPYCQQHCKGFIWIGCNLPYPIQSSSNPTAPSIELWQSIITSFRTARPQFVAEALPGIFGVPAGASISTKTLEHYERIVAQADGLAIERTNKILAERDFTPSVRRLGEQGEVGVRLLLLHGDSDSGMPYEASAGIVKELVPSAQVKLYEKGGHGLQETHAEQLLQDILDFARSDGDEKRA